MSLGNGKDSESSVSDEKFIKDFDWIFLEKGELFEPLDPTDWDIVEDILRDKVSPSPPVILGPPHISRCQENSDVWTSPRNDKDSESSVFIKTLLEEFNLTLREDLKDEVPTNWDSIE